MGLVAGFASHRGLVRQTNEDSFLVRKGLYVVCDGMGEARGGEISLPDGLRAVGRSQFRLRGARRNCAKPSNMPATPSPPATSRPHLLGMGTTLYAAPIRDSTVILGHVGDSRAYLLRAGALRQLTDDHSWVGEMVRRGELTAAQAAVHPHRSVITRALGTDGMPTPTFWKSVWRWETG